MLHEGWNDISMIRAIMTVYSRAKATVVFTNKHGEGLVAMVAIFNAFIGYPNGRGFCNGG
jgi:hypothetical protein